MTHSALDRVNNPLLTEQPQRSGALEVVILDHPVIQRCQLHKVRINRPSRPGSRRQVGRAVAV
jgi:hypothetical protein